MNVFSMEKEDIERNAESVKIVILQGLINDKVITKEFADKWTANHAVLVRKKLIFERIIESVKDTQDKADGYYYILVKRASEVD